MEKSLVMNLKNRNLIPKAGIWFLIPVLVLFSVSLNAQQRQQRVFFDGYVSDIQQVMFDSIGNDWLMDNVIHNRLNLEVIPHDNIRFVLQARNRMIFGNSVTADPGYAIRIDGDQNFTDLSFNIATGNSFVLNSTIDRAFLELTFDKFEVVAGRQRINWSNTFVWNPNDLFNVYSYFEVDYPERPGCDAVSVKYYPSYSSQIQGAVTADSAGKITAAMFGRFNIINTDIQFLGGILKEEDYVLGMGWVTDIRGLSFRGEGSWFYPLDNNIDTSAKILVSAGLDYTFSNSVMLQTEWMYCNNPYQIKDGITTAFNGAMDVRDLAWSKYSGFAAVSYPFNPIINATIAGIWFPDLKGFFAGPSLEFSVAENFNFSIIHQYFKTNAMLAGTSMAKGYQLNMFYLRMKYHF
jgi:hypothetical protein